MSLTDAELSLKIATFLQLKPKIADPPPSYAFAVTCDWPDMVNDPAMTVMLMKRHDFVSCDYIEDEEKFYSVVFCPNETHSLECAPSRGAERSDFGRSVAEAFAKAKGLL